MRERSAPPEKRGQFQALREKMERVEKAGEESLRQLRGARGEELLDAMEATDIRFHEADPEYFPLDAESAAFRERMRKSIRESKELDQLFAAAGDDKKKAVGNFQRYVAANPDSQQGWSLLGVALQNAEDFDASIVAYRTAERLANSQEEPGRSISAFAARLNVGAVLHKKGDLPAAIAECVSLIADVSERTESLLPMAYFQLGDILKESGDTAGAREAWRETIRRDTTGIMAKAAREKLRGL